MSDAPALALRGIVKRFGATLALDGADCVVRRGTVHALLGENGAGKTTLMRIAFGLTAPDSGTVELSGTRVHFTSSADAIRAGIGMVHQHFMLVPAFTVAENCALSAPSGISVGEIAARVRRLADDTGLHVAPDARIASLPVGAQQRAEILRALTHDASILILDEPTAVLTPTEADELYAWLRRFVAAGGTVVLITHKVADALAIADHVTVLRRGRVVVDAPRADLAEPELVTAIVGGDSTPDPQSGTSRPNVDPATAPVFAARAVSVVDRRGVEVLHDATVDVRGGEVLGVIGVEGSGYRELLRVLAGRLVATAGTVTRPTVVGFIPEDRHLEGVIPEFSLVENLALAGLSERRGAMPWRELAESAAQIITRFDVRATGARDAMRTLSGGNQQRFVVGRERGVAPRALVAEHPTRGLDVRAAERVLASIRAVADEGGAAVVYSADLDEVLSVATRVVACVGGRLVEVQAPSDPTDRTPYARALAGLAV